MVSAKRTDSADLNFHFQVYRSLQRWSQKCSCREPHPLQTRSASQIGQRLINESDSLEGVGGFGVFEFRQRGLLATVL
jgi:hypothetical protein